MCIAFLYYTVLGDKMNDEEFLTGVIKIKSNNRNAYKLDIPFCVTVYSGLVYNLINKDYV